MTCTVVAFAGLKASDYKELLKLDHSNGDTLRVNGKVDGKGPVLTAGEDLAVFTIDQDEGSSASAAPNSGASLSPILTSKTRPRPLHFLRTEAHLS